MTSLARMFLALLLTLVASGVLAGDERSAASVPPGELRKVALVVGNGLYANALALPNTSNDANDVCAALKRLDFDVICKLNIGSKREFKDAIFDFTGRINEKTVAFFYFAGHGLQIDGLNYLVPTNAALRTKSDIEDESVPVNYLMNELESRHAALNIFVFDACRNNPFINPIRGYAPTLGLASQLYTPRNSILALATGPGQMSLDGTGRNSTFTKNLLRFMPTPRQSVEEMLKAASGAASADARRLGHLQDPQLTISYTDKYCLAGCTDRPLVADGAARHAKAEELDALQATIAQTKAKQLELDTQKAALLKKQAELDALEANLKSAAALQAERAQPGRAGIQGKGEADAQISASAAKLQEMEALKTALLKKQEELKKLGEMLSVQQAGIDVKNQEVRTRAVEVKEETKKPLPIVPVF
jgi:uncharacterized caspase-like protein